MAAFDNADACEFALEITTPITFRNAIEIVGHTLALATFYIERDAATPASGEVCLKVDTMDVAQICAIKLRIAFHGFIAGGAGARPSFTLKLRMLLVLLKTMATTDTLHIYRVRGEDNLRLRSVGADTQEYELKTLAETYAPVAINDIVGAAFSIEFDIQRLKMMTKVAHSVRADHLRFRVSPCGDGAFALVVSCDGDDAQGLWEFRSAPEGADADADAAPSAKRLRITARASDGADADADAAATKPKAAATSTYDATFPVGYIASFVKAMDRAAVVLTLSAGHPLVIEYPLGLEHSNIRFLLAPRVA